MTVFPVAEPSSKLTVTQMIAGGCAALAFLLFFGSLLLDNTLSATDWHLWSLFIALMGFTFAWMIGSPKGVVVQTISSIVGALALLMGTGFLAVSVGIL